YDGVVLTKLDGDARGGAALSIVELTGRPIMFASSGEKLEDFDMFHPDRMASRILDLGDVLTLIEQAEKAFDAEQTASLAGRLASGEGQKQMKAMFSGGIPGMPPMPGMGGARRAAGKSARKKAKKKAPRSGDPRRAAEIARGGGAQGGTVPGIPGAGDGLGGLGGA